MNIHKKLLRLSSLVFCMGLLSVTGCAIEPGPGYASYNEYPLDYYGAEPVGFGGGYYYRYDRHAHYHEHGGFSHHFGGGGREGDGHR